MISSILSHKAILRLLEIHTRRSRLIQRYVLVISIVVLIAVITTIVVIIVVPIIVVPIILLLFLLFLLLSNHRYHCTLFTFY